MKRPAYLTAAGVMSALIGLLHLVIIFVGSPGYLYFGAGKEMADAATSGSLIPPAITLFVAIVFFLFAAYAYSGAGRTKKLPGLKVALAVIALIFLLRGISVFGNIASYLAAPGYPFRYVIFSLVSLGVGILYTLGFFQYLRTARKQKTPE